MNDLALLSVYFVPMLAILGLFWNVARKLGAIESDIVQVRQENVELRSDIRALRDLLSILLDERRRTP